ncbi:RNA polymerase factor sigma-54 [Phorcysia thermohydrogeniphila]|uniref:RNA polymerase RpoN-/SigL-like sigma 54 subunit n=1 Tax=Phorcysia thermohydrogeniphila TaxID=936138 RepID=A0A4R1GHL1_9BACT|nr:RNA polymerase factor sigma-54 [Phorcysia thermohydrogeniphila]TCK05369.1 RNA polymerase RpoN-/SigL-like sigma 54 subunit [Phorcysia thermohydrogeniphila]
MAELRYDLKLSLQLKLTPSVYLHLEVLQLPLLKLEEAIKNEIEENPLLELEEGEEAEKEIEEREIPEFIFEGGNVFPAEEEEKTVIPSRLSLRESLLQQAAAELEGKELEIAKLIIENLDERGFLSLTENEIAKELSVPTETVKKVREVVKQLSPAGCGSYSVKEAFKAQLQELEVTEKFISAIDHLELLSKSRKDFQKKVGLTDKELEEFLALLKRLDPQPGNLGDFNLRIVPDLRVYLKDENVIVEVLQPGRFNLKINTFYLKHATREELKKYIYEKYQRAINLKKAIEQRNETLKKIGKVVFEHQKEFLKDGRTLKPLSYHEVAEKLSIHESTISRAVKDKFVETPHGVYPFKFFFKKGIGGISTESVKERIKQIIENEDKKKPLSDSKIAEILKKEGIKIARRTVAKYREEMGIPSAFERREK